MASHTHIFLKTKQDLGKKTQHINEEQPKYCQQFKTKCKLQIEFVSISYSHCTHHFSSFQWLKLIAHSSVYTPGYDFDNLAS